MDKGNFKRIFFRGTRQNYAKDLGFGKDKVEEFDIVKECHDGGCFYEYLIVWHRFPQGAAARVEIYHDAFVAFEEEKELFHRLSTMKNPTPDEVHLLLLELGYEDCSDDKEVPKTCQKQK